MADFNDITMAPSERQIDLFRAVEDIHELTAAIVVLLTDRDGVAVAASGDEDDLPAPLRAILSGTKLAQAGSVIALLEPIAVELSRCPLNFTILAVSDDHVLTIAFDAEPDLDEVQLLGREGAQMLGQILSS